MPMTAVCTLHFSTNAVKAQWLTFYKKWPQLTGSIVETVHLLFSLNASERQTLTQNVCLLPNNNYSRLLLLKLLLQLLVVLLLLLLLSIYILPSISPVLLRKVIVGGLFMAICHSCHPTNTNNQVKDTTDHTTQIKPYHHLIMPWWQQQICWAVSHRP